MTSHESRAWKKALTLLCLPLLCSLINISSLLRLVLVGIFLERGSVRVMMFAFGSGWWCLSVGQLTRDGK